LHLRPALSGLLSFPLFFYKTVFLGEKENNKTLYHLKLYVMEIVGNLTKDTKSETLHDERKVLRFSIAVNDRYRQEGKEAAKITTYFNRFVFEKPEPFRYSRKSR
jgi:hypothetical protein